jgi:PIN domain nuclease of toxin-antitoxin system
MLVERGGLAVDGDPVAWVEDMVRTLPRREAAVTHEVAIESRRVKLQHQDPADRFLAATAAVYQLTLVTGDERLLHAKGFAVMANR